MRTDKESIEKLYDAFKKLYESRAGEIESPHELGNPKPFERTALTRSSSPTLAEELRQRVVPDYHNCPYSSITTGLYDQGREGLPEFVRCSHGIFGPVKYGECLGQCALAFQMYGKGVSGKGRGGRILIIQPEKCR